MQTGSAGLDLIKTSEGFRSNVYNDIAGNPTVGYGHKLTQAEIASGHFAAGITGAQGETLLLADLAAVYEPAVNRLVDPSCNQNQFDALVDFCYNEGPRNFATMMSHGWSSIAGQIPRWVYAEVNGQMQPVQALVTRRQNEVVLFNTPLSG